MKLAAGEKLGPHVIEGPIGKGGMGEVYRARDTRLNRPVAIKVSKRDFHDRFEREAHAISALNHPNVCTLYDIGPNYLVMEFVEGETLSKIIERGPLPLDKALAYAIQIVDALAAAHAKGIIHRDLKPGNIIITKNGVKVLDFGLAKLSSERESSNSDSTDTVTEPITHAGAVLGTLPYMSPEQVEGKEAGERSDIFSFGCVLYEMITGQRPFNGDTQAAMLASLMRDQPPPMNQKQPAVPRALERLVRKCIEKNPDDRWQSARDLKPALELIDLDAPSISSASASASQPIPVQVSVNKKSGIKSWLWPAIAGLFAVVAVGTAWKLWPKAPIRATRFQVTLPEGVQFSEYVSVSPDGHKLLFNATGQQRGLWIRDLDTLEWKRLSGTEGATSPFWSPDSKYLGFALRGQLKKVELAGGAPQIICDSPNPVGSGAWNKDGVIVFGGFGVGPIRRVSAAGGVPTEVTQISKGGGFHTLPTFLPDGKHFLYLRLGTPETSGIYAASIDVKPAEQPAQRIMPTSYGVPYVDGYLFFMQEKALMAQSFDATKLQLRGDPFRVADNVGTSRAIGIFGVSHSVLAYREVGGAPTTNLQTKWLDREGKVTSQFGQPGPDRDLALSPDGSRAVGRDAETLANGDLWLLDFSRGVRTRFTFHQSFGSSAVWSPDGSRIAFAPSLGGGSFDTLYEKAASGAGEEKELFKKRGDFLQPTSWSRDGRYLLFHTSVSPKTGADLWVVSLEGESKGTPLLATEFQEGQGAFSPDGRWIAYTSTESGRAEVYVRPFVASGPALGEGKWQVSKDGGAEPKWRSDGREIVFSAGTSAMAVEVNGAGAGFQLGTPRQLFTGLVGGRWDMTSDGKRFLVSVAPEGQSKTQAPITVVLNWEADLKN